MRVRDKIVEAWECLKDGWDELPKRGKVIAVLAAASLFIFIPSMIYQVLTEYGCVTLSLPLITLYGLFALTTAVSLAICTGVCAFCILFILPATYQTIVDHIVDHRENKRQQREDRERYGLLPPRVGWSNIRHHVLLWSIVLGGVLGLSVAIGYIAWLVVC